ncbi:MAG: bifunctional diaminohydroxyphosphoribosylaminopyrimidine deaminase/5-amino-6-(5-phosphoribosylamino)uracil reductase RibD [Vicinamibacterales bacterium]|nr:riboflavin biosynthesis protein RibD [Acidobacteriota bacterium]MDP6373949.1 bifunctional diaminohydroxyphosphoribosylaminopyrimidine deaminase/5-amino-6-(5-phosphoribosylamino)uracil reductase RibD [Vicinamibacterales bacterium]MDP6609472.1 bifunctional diaminohydroxyphosphoribosylaminopyrimidine deaminase/5-amino-6-(5-phosphoribosylamino)uracil reductase RibD [Vicinamibacterales bacterium]HAK56260.1 bifunctional diaminohydroxyphosphoribosylaminopyrimidine deaminase/5-amino-6-(5-phosphoribos
MPLGDAEYMDRALSLAARGRGLTSPNPLVGAVVVSPDGVVVGSGYHERAGEPHAEIHALRAAGGAARGATLFSTLEPCCHTGRTGPCVDSILEAGVARVVVGVEDPNPRVRGGGVQFLREHGVDVTVGVREAQAARLNLPFFVRVRYGRPLVMLKVALSRDGYVARRSGVRSAITAPAAVRDAHALRAEFDAIAVGSDTALVDDPVLTAREVHRVRPLTRVIFDSRLRTPPASAVFGTRDAGPIVIVTSEADVAAVPERAAALEHAGARLLQAPRHDLPSALRVLGAEGVTSLLLEGGPRLHAAAWEARVVDRVRLYVSPAAFGAGGVPWFTTGASVREALDDVDVRMVGPDECTEGYVHRTD